MNIEEQLDHVLLLPEASLARIYSHHRDREFAIVTAHRADMDPDQNRENMISLKGDVRAAGYGYIPLEGIGQERTDREEPECLAAFLLRYKAYDQDHHGRGLAHKAHAVEDPNKGHGIKIPGKSVGKEQDNDDRATDP